MKERRYTLSEDGLVPDFVEKFPLTSLTWRDYLAGAFAVVILVVGFALVWSVG